MNILDKVYFTGMSLIMLTATPSPLDSLNGNGNGTFDGLQNTLLDTLASANSAIKIIGICVLGVAAVVACICLGLMKDSSAVKEHKKWLVRILGAAIGIGCAITLVGIALDIGSKIK